MLIYHPAYDANHCIFRMLLLLSHSDPVVRIDEMKIMDFYVLFPHLLKSIRLPARYNEYKKSFSKLPEPYEHTEKYIEIFHQLSEIQNAAIANMLSKDILDIDSYYEGKVKRSDNKLPESLSRHLKGCAYGDDMWFTFVAKEIPRIGINGPKGLKARTGLMEFRYDV